MRFAVLERILREATQSVAPAIVCRAELAGQPLFQGSFGWLDPETRQQPTPPDTLFDLASVTKLFTTTAFLRLVDRGKVRLDQAVVEVIPEFAGVRPIGGAEDPLSKEPLPADPRWAGQNVDPGTVTFRHLLTHTGGLPAWRSLYRMLGPPPRFPLPRVEIRSRQAQALAAIAGFPFIYPPGQGYAYSDIGLILLGWAVTRLSGCDRLDAAIRELVTGPLGLAAHFDPAPPKWAATAPTEVCGWRQRRLQGEVHDENAGGLGGIAGHAGLFGTAADVCRLGRLYLNRGGGLLSPAIVAASLREQYAGDGVRRGLGWLLRSGPDPSCSAVFSPDSFGHTGFTGTSLWCDPARDLCVALLTNRVYHGRDPAGIIALRPRVHRAIVEEMERT